MTHSFTRLAAIREVTSRTARSIQELAKGSKLSDIYGSNTFSLRTMQEKLPKEVFKSLRETIRRGTKLDHVIAGEVAHAVKEWALEQGATHFCHWFQPQTGLTAEKHDAFLSFDEDGQPIERFSGSQLIQSEPDASSFPSGGVRTTFEARGYTAWDPSSPIFIIDGPNGKTLCIPSVFIGYHGEALDNKTPLLRSMEVLSEKALDVLKLFGNETAVRVVPTVGPEQEYFLVDRALYLLRPDLIAAGRTLVGARPPKGQQLEDHYFGSINDRILAFMQETEYELYKLGIPVKTRHNEVAPSQYESAPIFEEANVASDHNQIVMETMKRVARRHQLALLLNEKPFAGVNGSGKHCNWSLMDSEGRNLLEPGQTPERNLQFLVFLMAVVSAVDKRAGLLRAAIASYGNDHRLGANEAPPAIISVFLGESLTRILDGLEKGENGAAASIEKIGLGVTKLPEVARDNTDRNRTSPFAFTGNKFEFRAVSSAAAVSIPMAYLNAAVAESLVHAASSIKGRMDSGDSLDAAALAYVRDQATSSRRIRFEGNNYSSEWVEEAARRGLPNLKTTPDALAELVTPENIELLSSLQILSERETRARHRVRLERYVKDAEIEAQSLRSLTASHVLPAAYKQLSLLEQAGSSAQAVAAAKKRLGAIADELTARLDDLRRAADETFSTADLAERARLVVENVIPAMEKVREKGDLVERAVADEFWTLPKYRELLFVI